MSRKDGRTDGRKDGRTRWSFVVSGHKSIGSVEKDVLQLFMTPHGSHQLRMMKNFIVVFVSVCVSLCVSVSVCICLWACLCVCMSICVFVCLSSCFIVHLFCLC